MRVRKFIASNPLRAELWYVAALLLLIVLVSKLT